VAQRRRRVFVIGYAGNWRPAAAVLFERHSMCGYPAPSREKGQGVAASIESGATISDYDVAGTLDKGVPRRGIGHNGNYDSQVVSVAKQWAAEITSSLCAADGPKGVSDQYAHEGKLIALASGQGGAEIGIDRCPTLTCNHEAPIAAYFVTQPIALAENTIGRKPENGGNHDGFTEGGPMYTLNATGVHGVAQAIPIDTMNHIGRGDKHSMGDFVPGAPSYTLTKGHSHAVAQPMAYTLSGGSNRGLHVNKVQVATCLDTHNAVGEFREQSQNAQTLVAQPIAFSGQMSNPQTDVDIMQTLQAKNPMAVCLGGQHPNAGIGIDQSPTLTNAMGAGGGHIPITNAMAVRRLTPVECERLQGFPDNYTDIKAKGKPTPDGPRYKALGNSMAVPVMAWIGKRIQEVEAINAP